MVDIYIASQASTAAHSYDAENPNAALSRYTTIRNIYADYPDSGLPYYDGIENVCGKSYNFHNRYDAALSGWEWNVISKPDRGYTYDFLGNPFDGRKWLSVEVFEGLPVVFRELFLSNVDDRYAIFAHIAPAHSRALGRVFYDETGNVQGLFMDRNVDLNKGFRDLIQNFGDSDPDHSAQFLYDNMSRHGYWEEVLKRTQLGN